MNQEFEKYLDIVDQQLELIKIYYKHSDKIQNKESFGDSSMLKLNRFKPAGGSEPKSMAELKVWIEE